MLLLERTSQEEWNDASFSSIAPSSEELWMWITDSLEMYTSGKGRHLHSCVHKHFQSINYLQNCPAELHQIRSVYSAI